MSSISVSLTAGMRSNLFSLQQTGKLLNMLMLQTRQVLGTTALSLASQVSQPVLRLF